MKDKSRKQELEHARLACPRCQEPNLTNRQLAAHIDTLPCQWIARGHAIARIAARKGVSHAR